MIAAVLGGASGGFDELAALGPVDAVYAVNDAASEYPGELAAFVTLHPEKLHKWLPLRSAPTGEVIAHEAHPLVTRAVDYRFPGMNASGSSGLFATKIALEAGADRVVLCGVPMDAVRAHYFDPTAWSEVEAFRDAWHIALPHLSKVRSMSGWTAELLGKPF